MKQGRRFWITVISSAVYTLLVIGAYIDQGGYVTLQLMTVGAYLAANGHQKHMEITNGAPKM